MEALSQRYGWTPDQIRESKVSDINQYLEIIAEINRQEKIMRMKNKK